MRWLPPLLLCLATGCFSAGSEDSASAPAPGPSGAAGGSGGTSSGSPPASSLKGLELRTGLLGVNDVFVETGATLYTCENAEGINGQFALQVGARVSGQLDFNPELVRIAFTSDHAEWVGSVAGENEVYASQEECEATGRYCEEVVVGEGESGYFQIDDGHIAIQNLWCRYFGGTEYSFQMQAQGIDLNPWPYEPFTEIATLEIRCVPRPCCPDNDYIDTWGNHTVEPWDCP